jgi:hypothetical protein
MPDWDWLFRHIFLLAVMLEILGEIHACFQRVIRKLAVMRKQSVTASFSAKEQPANRR